jgi:iron complex outermembrane receptor protein
MQYSALSIYKIMIKKSFLIIFLLCSFFVNAQEDNLIILSGKIIDSENGEALIGASILVKTGVGTVADLDGNFMIKLPKGDYNIVVSMLGYTPFKQKLKLTTNKKLEIKLENNVLNEVEVVASVAQIRETPVAFSSISATKLQEELGGKDISMIANTTPGAYASSSGGGAGDSRVTIRGFDQTNIGVLVDGIPVNDMENGQVYWSNWEGLKDITKSTQIQRGLGASKLAISSVGGTMNFITNGIEQKKQMIVKKEWGNNRRNLMSMSYNSGLINNKWGFTLAGTYQTSDGWVEGTWNNAYSYFAKIQYMPSPRHIISIGVNAAPQSHGQRTSKMQIVVYDKEYAKSLGIDADKELHDMVKNTSAIKYTTPTQGDRSLQWNPDQGLLNGKAINDKVNYFNKPLFNLNHFWKISDKTTLSTVFYASFGSGGGTGYTPSYTSRDSITGYYNIQAKYNSNSTFIDSTYSYSEHKSTMILRSVNNNHKWFGLLSTATTKLNKLFTLTYGVDLRYYRGYHNYTVYDLLGGDYYVEGGTNANPNLNPLDKTNFVKRKGDVFGSNYNGLVKWAGLFGQGEFKKDKWTAFLTASGSYSGYNRIDYYKPKDLVLDDTTYYNTVKYNTIITHDGVTYDRNSEGIRTATTGWRYQIGYTLKGGANYNINEHHNGFLNVGVMQIPQKFANVFTFSNEVAKDFKPQYIKSFELGYGLKFNKFYGNINAYYTTWDNQPQATIPGADGETYNINGVSLLYKGLEFEGTYKPIKQIEIEGILSLGDWIYNSGGTVYGYDQNGVIQTTTEYYAKGVHVGNAAQTQAGIAVRFMPIKGFYFKPRFTHFDKYYSNFKPTDLNAGHKNQESWKIPGYSVVDLSTGYEIPFGAFKVNLYATINNLLNTRYINDAQNNGLINSNGFDATSATVFFGTGRTFVFGTKLTF